MGGGELAYDVPAEGYDELYGEEQVEKYAAAFRELAKQAEEIQVVLDVGCATGLLARFLELRGFNGIYLGVDLAADRLKIAKGRSHRVAVVQADAHALPIRSGAADLAACFTTIHLLDLRRALAELARASRKIAIITLLKKRLDLKQEILKLLKECFKGWILLERSPDPVKDELYILVKHDDG